jgi:hypothetical protein
VRFARDRDLDGVLDGDEGVSTYDLGTGCEAQLRLSTNSAPELGNANFGLVIEGGTPGDRGILVIAPGVSSAPGAPGVIGLQRDAVLTSTHYQFDARGAAVVHLPLPNTPTLAGRTYQVRALGRGACGVGERPGSNGLHLTLMP